MPKDENLNDSRASANGGLAGSSEIGMNESGTSGKSGTYLTQAGSGFDLENTRRQLIALRLKLGASVTIGGLNDGTPESPYEMMDAKGETHAPLTEDGVTALLRSDQ